MTTTIETIATAIAENSNFSADSIAADLAAESSEATYFNELKELASDAETSVEVLEAIQGYCAERVDSDAQDDPHYFIKAEAYGTLQLKEYGVRAVTTREQLDELDHEIPGIKNIEDFESESDWEDSIVAAFEAHNEVELDGHARDIFQASIRDTYVA
ncbi:hypothetical protein ACWG8W_06065 [Citricoccus zhacaiensis]